MSKVLMVVLAAGAFVCAVWLVVSRGRLPEPARVTGLRRRFYLAVLLFVGLLTSMLTTSCGRQTPPQTMCYEPMERPTASSEAPVSATLKAVWLTLDPENGEKFREKLAEAVEEGEVEKQVSAVVQLAFKELAYHREYTRGAGRGVMCYKMTRLGSALATSRENGLKQLELLRKAQESGSIDEETAAKAREALSRELELFDRASRLGTSRGGEAEKALVESYSNGEVEPGDAAQRAAALIVELEGGKSTKTTEGE